MTTDRELMQQALDALENAEDQLAKPYSTEAGYAIAALRERLAQPEQEPVAWIITTELQDGTRLTHPLTGRFKDVQDRCDFGDPIPLYTAPPQREWQGLTEQESGAIMEELNAYGTRLYEFARAIEARLKEKNT